MRRRGVSEGARELAHRHVARGTPEAADRGERLFVAGIGMNRDLKTADRGSPTVSFHGPPTLSPGIETDRCGFCCAGFQRTAKSCRRLLKMRGGCRASVRAERKDSAQRSMSLAARWRYMRRY